MATLAKLTRPKTAGVCPRKRLFALIDDARRRRAIWVSGPPGCGKTTLLASYLEARKLRALWYQVDAGDRDIATFFHYLRQAAAVTLPRHKFKLPPLTPEYLADLPAFTRRYFRSLFGRLPGPCLLVLDNFNEASDELSGILRDAIGEVPDDTCIITISRSNVPPELARVQATRELTLIDAEELRLTLEEARDIAAAVVAMEEATLRRLHATVDGWAAGLVLLLERYKRSGTHVEVDDPESQQAVFDYFAIELFARISPSTRNLLLRTAFLPRMTAAMAQQISGEAEAEKMLDELCLRHLFTNRHARLEPTYQYHGLLRAFLGAQVRAAFTAIDLMALKRQSAQVLEQDQQTEEAYDLYCSAGDWSAAARLAMERAQALLAQGRWQTLVAWLRAFPTETLVAEPWLQYWLGAAQLAINPARARDHLELAYAQFKTQRDAKGSFLALSGVLDSFFLEWSDLIAADNWIAEMEQLLLHYPQLPSPEIEARVLSSLMCVEFRKPQHPLLAQWTERAWYLMNRCGDPQLRLMLAGLVFMHHLWRGDFKQLRLLFTEIGPSLVAPNIAPILQIRWKAYEANFRWLSSSPDSAFKVIDEARALSEASGVHVLDHVLFVQGGHAALAAGRLDIAEKMVALMESSVRGSRRFDLGRVNFLKSGLALFKGDLAQAVRCGVASLDIAQQYGMEVAVSLTRQNLAQALIERGDYAEARNQLTEALQRAQAMANRCFEHACLLLEAYLLLRIDRKDDALANLRRGLAIGREQDYIVVSPWALPHVVAQLYETALSAGIEVEYVQGLIRLHGLKPASPDIEYWPWQVKVHTLGRFSIAINGKGVNFTRKTPKKPIALLKAIIALGGRDVSEQQLIDALWLDEEGDAAHNALAVNLHRLRKLIGDNDAVVLRDGRVSIDARRCWVDCWAFERLLRAVMEVPAEQRAPSLEKALGLYRGSFLEGDADAPWTLSMRERLRGKFIRHCAKLAQLHEEELRWQDAIACYLRGLETDELAEEFYQGLMRCYHRIERNAEGIAAYRRLRHTLSVVLGIGTSPASEELYRSLFCDP